ncbi:probable cysteine--tRNA ligase, mitochondrial [Rhagoletis pomonella]|uniref:probable cysteine--tRNA ligase, mitochondrial n=1 Tax=Rhagoletis pomonella TaxID=28610 RepID=UPI00177BA5B6|nr:probable cysteine--tRNA ligase, mitochondrial [Rhagoletis pomonella]
MSRSCFLKPNKYWPLATQRFASQHQWQQPTIGKDVGIRIYNCTARHKVPLILSNNTYATWYTCGPTVYDSMHLGHASCYVKLDIIQRILREHFNMNLVTAMNVTDIDDKIIQKSVESRKSWRELSRFYESEFWSDLRLLNVHEPNIKLRVTEQMPYIVDFIRRIVEQGQAYEGSGGSIYFDVNKCANYGKLQKVNLLDTAGQTTVKDGKMSAADFSLWKAQKNEKEPSWTTPWGAGRPGWHIECSTLASMIFGKHIDFHAGGLDLRFPHHENEEAQSCAYHNTQQWVNYWLHTGQLHVKGQKEKMSKSLKNTISVGKMLQHYTADEFRMACALSNYRNEMQYSEELMQTSRNTLKRFRTFRADCLAYLSGKKQSALVEASELVGGLQRALQKIDACYKDDFDTASSITVLLDQASTVNRHINAADGGEVEYRLTVGSCMDAIAAVDNAVQQHLGILGFDFVKDSNPQAISTASEFDLDGLVEDLLQSRRSIRELAVAAKNKELFRICDELRNCLRQHGIDIQDHSQGTSWQFSGKKK